MTIPLLDLSVQHQPIQAELMAAIERVLSSQGFILGPDVAKLEERVAAYSQARYGIGVSSGPSLPRPSGAPAGEGRGRDRARWTAGYP